MLTKWKPNTTNLLLRNTLTEENSYAFELDLDHGETPDGTPFSSTEMNKIVDEVNRNTPPGIISAFAGNRAPEGWLLCDGKVYKTEFYEQLYSVIGNTYGGDTGKGEFALPNLCGRVPVGLDSTQAEFDVPGKAGGEKTHLLLNSEVPSHTIELVEQLQVYGEWMPSGHQPQAEKAHNNLQPYLVLNFIIKY